jgi:hypothetical protein
VNKFSRIQKGKSTIREFVVNLCRFLTSNPMYYVRCLGKDHLRIYMHTSTVFCSDILKIQMLVLTLVKDRNKKVSPSNQVDRKYLSKQTLHRKCEHMRFRAEV